MVKTGPFKAIDSLFPLEEHLATSRGTGYSLRTKSSQSDQTGEQNGQGTEKPGYSLRYLSENEIESPWILSLNFQGQSNNSKEWNFGDDQLRLRRMIYLVILADVVESVRDAIGFEYCLASSSGWTKDWESSLTRLELVQKTTDKVVLIKEKLKAARGRQKSYADNGRKPLEFEVGDRVLLKVSPWKGVIRFGNRGKLAQRYVGPFEILERIDPIAYRLRLPEELSGNLPMKTSISFLGFGTLVGHKTANSWNLLTWANEFHQDKASSVRVSLANFTLQSSIQLLQENTNSVRSNQRIRPTAPSVPLKLKGWKLRNSL
ncbi:hypothetical protein Tco_1449963 [Tanacetum coccineum]